MKDKEAYQVDTGGLRGEKPLPNFLILRIAQYIQLIELGAPSKVAVIRWVDDKELNTAYSPGFDLLNIGSDVRPAPIKVTKVKWITKIIEQASEDPEDPQIQKYPIVIDIKWRGKGTLTANTRLTWKSSIAHELVGHREAALAGKTQAEDPLEEAQASIRAAKFAPSLTSTERYTLLRDGITRLHKAGIKVHQVKNILHINNR